MSNSTPTTDAKPARPLQRPAIGPRLRIVYRVVLVLFAAIVGNSAYLGGVTALDWLSGEGGSYQTHFYLWMFLAHVVLGLAIITPFVLFGLVHARNTWRRKNRRAVRVGFALLGVCLLVLVTGLLLVRTFVDLKHPATRSLVYWLHVGGPIVGAWLYWLHRLVGPRLRWRAGLAYGGVAVALFLLMVGLHATDPRWNRPAPESGAEYFEPSLATTADGRFVPASSLMQDESCRRCHPDVHERWSHSAHRFSSFNNPMYFASVSETRRVALARDGNVKASRWCAGCHDPVPFFSGRFDDPEFDMLADPTARAGITCTACHAISHVDSVRGNADYTIEEPVPYPFEGSDNALLSWMNEQLIKAKPSMHKRTFLKPLHRSAEFCGACHKVHLPYELTHYKEFLRGQNHYDSWRQSGVSGLGARSFYYPPQAESNCNGCHMPTRPSDDFGARPGADGELAVHDHLFPSANTALPWLRDEADVVAAHRRFLEDITRVDVFGVREGGRLDGELHAPLRPLRPTLVPGKRYLFEIVVRTTKMGHHLTQGTIDSNELWVDVTVRSGDRVIGRSGGIDESRGGEVDPWACFLNGFLLDQDGNRIERRNAQDIFTKLYDHQIPPGAARSLHYAIELPQDLEGPITIEASLRYRKFDKTFMDFVADHARKVGRPLPGDDPNAEGWDNELPIVTMAADRVVLPIEGQPGDEDENEAASDAAKSPGGAGAVEPWIRWNDYGIGLLLPGRLQLRQAEAAFREVEALGRWDGPLNLARLHQKEGNVPAAVQDLQRAAAFEDEPNFPWWTWSWLSGLVNSQQLHYDEAVASLLKVLEERSPAMVERGFDFSRDTVVINDFAGVLFDLASVRRRQERVEEAEGHEREAIRWLERAREIDPEDVATHNNLARLHERLGNAEGAALHRSLQQRYKLDETARGRAIRLARERYPAANRASEEIVIHWLQRAGSPGLPDSESRDE